MRDTFKILLCMTILAGTSACTLDEPTWVNPSRVEVHEEGYTDTFATETLDNATLRAIGVNYYRYGNGPMDVAVSYNPSSKNNSKSNALKQAQRIEKELRRQGVNDLRISTTERSDGNDSSSTMISFPALTAKAPQDCGLMPGYTDAQTGTPSDAEGNHKGYAIGCTVETLMAKQIARPGDLLGRPGFETDADGQRLERVVWGRGYYGLKSNPRLEGESATDSE